MERQQMDVHFTSCKGGDKVCGRIEGVDSWLVVVVMAVVVVVVVVIVVVLWC